MSPKWTASILVVAYLCLTTFAEDIQTAEPKASVNDRLPLNVIPIKYVIRLTTFLNEFNSTKFTFTGDVSIEILVVQNTNEIQLHMQNLNIFFSDYTRYHALESYEMPDAVVNNLTNIVVYKFNNTLKARNSYMLRFKYTGIMDEATHGFYRSSYTTPGNITKWLGVAHFHKTSARRVFPCFDEPNFKAIFYLLMTQHRSLNSIGPTKLSSNRLTEGEYITNFYQKTPLMSTYALGFIVSELKERSDGQFGVLARPEYYNQTEYSFNVGKHLLKIFNYIMGIPYHTMGIDKMQMAAIPGVQASGTENWGILTFRELSLLYDEEHSTLKSKQDIVRVVAHQLTHIWFGNLVTCAWWSYSWLHEGFARYYEYHAFDENRDKFEMHYQFVVDRLQPLMEMDATNSTRPMSNAKSDILGKRFNSISYDKGAALIRVTKYILGKHNFRTSSLVYLKKHQYTNTVPWHIIKIWKNYWRTRDLEYADRFYASFTLQVGYPVVTFNRTSETNVEVTQKRFLLKDFDKADPNLSYTVPITYTTNNEKLFTVYYPQFFLEDTPMQINVTKNTTWIIGNIRETGYYRVNYDNETWYKINASLHAENWDGIHELNRAQIVDDLFNFARAGEIEYGLAFDVLEYLKTETNYLPWTSAFKGLSFLVDRMGVYDRGFPEYIRHITEKAYNKLGFEERKNDTPLDIYTRTIILSWSCKYGNPKCISKAKSYFNKNLRVNPVPANIRAVVYCTVMREAKEEDFAKLYEKYESETVATEKTLLLKSLGCVRDSKLVSKVFHIIMSAEVHVKDKSKAFASLCTENNANVDLIFDLVAANIKQVSKAMRGYTAISSIILKIADLFTSEVQLDKLKMFNDKHKLKYDRILGEAVARVRSNLNWSNDNLESIKSYFLKYTSYGLLFIIIGSIVLSVIVIGLNIWLLCSWFSLRFWVS